MIRTDDDIWYCLAALDKAVEVDPRVMAQG
jgi:hypothetical protein